MPTTRGEIGKRIRFARELARLKQAALAKTLDVTPTTVWRWEQKGTAASVDSLEQIARICGVSFAWLVTGDGEARPREAKLSAGAAA